MPETVAEAVARHEADCPVCQNGHSKRCLERDTVEELAELRVALAAAEAERDRYLTRACVAEAKVAEVRELADNLSGEGPYAAAILTAIGGKP